VRVFLAADQREVLVCRVLDDLCTRCLGQLSLFGRRTSRSRVVTGCSATRCLSGPAELDADGIGLRAAHPSALAPSSYPSWSASLTTPVTTAGPNQLPCKTGSRPGRTELTTNASDHSTQPMRARQDAHSPRQLAKPAARNRSSARAWPPTACIKIYRHSARTCPVMPRSAPMAIMLDMLIRCVTGRY
jgi:hypothetical protein